MTCEEYQDMLLRIEEEKRIEEERRIEEEKRIEAEIAYRRTPEGKRAKEAEELAMFM